MREIISRLRWVASRPLAMFSLLAAARGAERRKAAWTRVRALSEDCEPSLHRCDFSLLTSDDFLCQTANEWIVSHQRSPGP
jgi:hypothetical protein